MSKQKEIEALEYAVEVLQKKIEKLKGGVTTQDDDDRPCPEGQIRNAKGECVDDIG